MQPAKLSLFDYIRSALVLIAFYVAAWIVVIGPLFLLFNTRYPRVQKIMGYLIGIAFFIFLAYLVWCLLDTVFGPLRNLLRGI
jgi:threonine/homoserine/homoserine lactone efflux protein